MFFGFYYSCFRFLIVAQREFRTEREREREEVNYGVHFQANKFHFVKVPQPQSEIDAPPSILK